MSEHVNPEATDLTPGAVGLSEFRLLAEMANASEEMIRNADLLARAEAAEAREAELRAKVERVEALGTSWVGFDDSHTYGDAVLSAIASTRHDDWRAERNEIHDNLMGEVESRLDALADTGSESELRWELGEWLTEIKRAALTIPPTTEGGK